MKLAKSHSANILFAAATSAALVFSTGASAATDGTLGSQSTGTVTINASVPDRVRISGLEDVNFTSIDPASTNVFNTQDVCLWSNTATRGYSLTATGSGAVDAFELSAGGLTVPYSVEWAGTTGATTGVTLSAGSAASGFISTATHQLCNTGPSNSASLIVRLADADLSTMQSGQTYTGLLTLLVQPE